MPEPVVVAPEDKDIDASRRPRSRTGLRAHRLRSAQRVPTRPGAVVIAPVVHDAAIDGGRKNLAMVIPAHRAGRIEHAAAQVHPTGKEISADRISRAAAA